MSAAQDEGSRARELGALLRSRRERLQPADVGLPTGRRRRARGLRREEVAMLAAISPTYYAFLEQGRDVTPSRQVLDALADALRLEPAERAHVHAMVHGAREPAAAEERIAPEVGALVDRLDPCPTYVTGRRWDVLAANRTARALYVDWPRLPPDERSMIWWMLTAPAARELFADWRAEAARQLGRFRAAAARHPDDPSFRELVDRLLAVSPEVREWWPRHDVTPLGSGSKRMRHRAIGEFDLHHVVLQVADAPEQKLVTFSGDAAVMAAIARLAQTSP